MAAMKTEFKLEWSTGHEVPGVSISIIGKRPENIPYVSINCYQGSPVFIPDKELERFAVNILKALKSKHLNQSNKT